MSKKTSTSIPGLAEQDDDFEDDLDQSLARIESLVEEWLYAVPLTTPPDRPGGGGKDLLNPIGRWLVEAGSIGPDTPRARTRIVADILDQAGIALEKSAALNERLLEVEQRAGAVSKSFEDLKDDCVDCALDAMEEFEQT